MADAKLGIVELQSAVNHLAAVTVKLVELCKDGVDLSDAVSLAGNEDLKKLIGDVMNFKEVFAEAKDLDLQEGLQLAVVLVPQIVDAFKK
jgi:hypothetical protein